jgi:acyl dehydratase
MGLNYGLNRVRLPAPVPSGSRLRATFNVQTVEEVSGDGEQGVVLATIEREGGDKPVCVAELVLRVYR